MYYLLCGIQFDDFGYVCNNCNTKFLIVYSLHFSTSAS